MRVVKGHGTGNDFVVLPDLDGSLDLTPALVRALCDRHTGVGADGVLRVVRSENDPEAKQLGADAIWFMDYRNADGSTAEMCGNGVRVFARYLEAAGLAVGPLEVLTRGGVRHVDPDGAGGFTVQMGRPRLLAQRPLVTVEPSGALPAARSIELPNPHVVVPIDTSDELAALELTRAPDVQPSRPDGQNVEFVVRTGQRRLQLRVHERGVGETRSCGTGICAAAVAAADGDGAGPDDSSWQVQVPGGSCTVRWRADGEVLLSGPAVLVGDVELAAGWLAEVASR